MFNINLFKGWARKKKDEYDYVAIGLKDKDAFLIPFDNEKQLRDFLYRNSGSREKVGFYVQGFVNGEYIGENRGRSPKIEKPKSLLDRLKLIFK